MLDEFIRGLQALHVGDSKIVPTVTIDMEPRAADHFMWMVSQSFNETNPTKAAVALPPGVAFTYRGVNFKVRTTQEPKS